MAGRAKRGRKPAPIRAETLQAQELAQFLRDLREKSGKTYDELAAELNWSRSSIGNHLSGSVPPMDVVLALVEATAPAAQLETLKARAVQLRERAANPKPAQVPVPRPAPGASTAAARFMADSTARLADADQRSHRLAQDLATSQSLIVGLTNLSTQLRLQIQQLAAVPTTGEGADQAQRDLSQAITQLEQAQHDLTEARQARTAAEALATAAQRRCLELEEELAFLRLDPDYHRTEPTGADDDPAPVLDVTDFLTDPARALATTRQLLDAGRTLRTEAAGQMGLAAFTAATDPAVRRSERWHAFALVLARTLGCLTAATAAVLHLVATTAHHPGWILITDPVALAGIALVTDPWLTLTEWWPWIRAALRRERLPRPLPISYANVAPRAVRALAAALATTGAVLTAQAGFAGAPWWWLLTVPATAALTAVAVAGYDRPLRRAARFGLADLTADLRAPRPLPPASPETAPVRLPWLSPVDPQWLDRRADELRNAISGRWRSTPLWFWLCLTPVLLPGLYGAGLGIGKAVDAFHVSRNALLATRTLDQAATRFLQTHTGGLPLTAGGAHALWLGLGVLTLLLSTVFRGFAARLTWSFWGVGTAVMVWCGAPVDARGMAAGLALIAWGLASIFALRGLGPRPRITTVNLIEASPPSGANDQPDRARDAPRTDEEAEQ